MTAATKWNLVSVADYLARELDSPVKREYVGGVIYAMAGARSVHNRIAANTLTALGVRLRGHPCEAFGSDMKIRVRLPTHTCFYYPDVSVVCGKYLSDDVYVDDPAALFEVFSPSTRRIDTTEKKDAYLTISSLFAYTLIETDSPTVVVHRRAKDGFVREVYTGLDAVIPLSEIGIELPLAEIYERVEFQPEPDGETN